MLELAVLLESQSDLSSQWHRESRNKLLDFGGSRKDDVYKWFRSATTNVFTAVGS